MTENQDSTKENTPNLSPTNLLNKFKDKLGWDSWNNWHPKSQTLVKLFPLLLILFAIPLTVNVLQQQQNLNQEAARRCYYSFSKHRCITPTPMPPTPTSTISSPTPTKTPGTTATPTSTSRKVVNVSSIPALKTALADNSVDEIVVANGRYNTDVAQAQTTNSLWIGSAFASRTRPVLVRAATIGGVTFQGGANLGLAFEAGAHDQTWDGFHFANMVGTIIEFGGFTPVAPAHDITLRNITIEASCHRSSSATNQDQGIYFSNAAGRGPYNLLLEDITIIGTDPLSVWSGIHAYHGDALNPPPDHVTIRRLTVNGTFNPIVLWDDTVGAAQHDWLIETATLTNALESAVRFESVGANNIVFKNITSTGSHQGGFYSSLGANPPGVTFINDSLK